MKRAPWHGWRLPCVLAAGTSWPAAATAGIVGPQICRLFLISSRLIKLAKPSPGARSPLRHLELELSVIGGLHVPESASVCLIEGRQRAFWLSDIEVKVPTLSNDNQGVME